MSHQSYRITTLKALLLCVVLLIGLMLTACQPTPDKPVIVNKNKDLVEEVINQPSPSIADESHKLKNIAVPDGHYTFTSQNDKASLTINVDAEIVKPIAGKMPMARVKPMEITQQMVTGMFNYLYPDEKPQLPRTQLTKGEIEDQIVHIKKTLSSGKIGDDPISDEDKTHFEQMVSKLEEDLVTAPEKTPDPVISDGTLQKVEENGQSYFELYVNLGEFNWLNIRAKHENDFLPIWYCKTKSVFTTDGMVKFNVDDTLPKAVQKHLTLPLSDAIALTDGFFTAAGIDDVKLFASYLTDNHGTGHVDDNWDPASEYAYKLFYTRTVNGVPVSCHMSDSASSDYTEPWFYESIEFTVTDDGIVGIEWIEPCAVTEIIEDDVDLIDFDQAVSAFENAATYIFGKFVEESDDVESTATVDIDSIQLNLVRLREKDMPDQKAGLYVPAYVFYGSVKEKTHYKKENETYENYRTSYGGGSDIFPGPLMVIAINAIDGSIINVMDEL